MAGTVLVNENGITPVSDESSHTHTHTARGAKRKNRPMHLTFQSFSLNFLLKEQRFRFVTLLPSRSRKFKTLSDYQSVEIVRYNTLNQNSNLWKRDSKMSSTKQIEVSYIVTRYAYSIIPLGEQILCS